MTWKGISRDSFVLFGQVRVGDIADVNEQH